MVVTASSNKGFLQRFIERLTSYSAVGVSTFLFDLGLISVLIFMFNVTEPIAIGVAFFIAVHLNYAILRLWVYRHTPEKITKTYIYFMAFAVLLSFIIPALVLFISNTFATNLLVSRIIISGLIGLISFLFNTFFNFKFL